MLGTLLRALLVEVFALIYHCLLTSLWWQAEISLLKQTEVYRNYNKISGR